MNNKKNSCQHLRDVLNGQSRSQIRLRRMKSTCGGGNRLRDEILLRREKEDGFDFIQGGSLGFHLNEVKISSWLDTISSESKKKREQNGFPFRSLFVIYRKFRICLTNASGYAHTLIQILR